MINVGEGVGGGTTPLRGLGEASPDASAVLYIMLKTLQCKNGNGMNQIYDFKN